MNYRFCGNLLWALAVLMEKNGNSVGALSSTLPGRGQSSYPMVALYGRGIMNYGSLIGPGTSFAEIFHEWYNVHHEE